MLRFCGSFYTTLCEVVKVVLFVEFHLELESCLVQYVLNLADFGFWHGKIIAKPSTKVNKYDKIHFLNKDET